MPFPTGFGDAEAAPLMCAGIVGYRALRVSGIGPGECSGFTASAASAHIAIQIAKYWGARSSFSRSAEHRRLARELGAAWTGTAQEEPPAKLTSAIIFAPVGSLYLDALRVWIGEGRCVRPASHMSPIPEWNMTDTSITNEDARSVANATRRDGEELLTVAGRDPDPDDASRTFPLAAANEVLRTLKAGRINGAAVARGLAVAYLDPFEIRSCYAIIISLFLTCAPVAQLDRASDYESAGRVFESPRARFSFRLPL